jgi:MSHA biogenesis protein MshP
VTVRARTRQSGMALVAALFLIVVVAALGVFAVRIGAGQQHTVNLALLGNRALAAANSGIEWGAQSALVGGVACPAGTLSLTEGALNGFTVTITCSVTSHAEGAATVRIFTLEAFARIGSYGTPDYVSRRVRARLTDAI